MTAQFKEMEQEMQAESEQSDLYIHLGWAWENSAVPRVRLWLQAGRQVDLQVLHRLRDMPESVICEKTRQYPMYFNESSGLTDGTECRMWKYYKPVCLKGRKSYLDSESVATDALLFCERLRITSSVFTSPPDLWPPSMETFLVWPWLSGFLNQWNSFKHSQKHQDGFYMFLSLSLTSNYVHSSCSKENYDYR